jgi:hypothetical protein
MLPRKRASKTATSFDFSSFPAAFAEAPQLVQITAPGFNSLPQFEQNFSPLPFAKPQFMQA